MNKTIKLLQILINGGYKTRLTETDTTLPNQKDSIKIELSGEGLPIIEFFGKCKSEEMYDIVEFCAENRGICTNSHPKITEHSIFKH